MKIPPVINACLLRRLTMLGLLGILLSATSCGIYRNRIMFATDQPAGLRQAVADTQRNYRIQEDDFLEIEVYTNWGELLIDPNFEIRKEIGVMGQQNQQRQVPRYLVQQDGTATLPVVGNVPLAGLTLNQADSLLAQRYATLYEAPFVITRYTNKRVIVLGATAGQVVPLVNENTNLIEVLALAGGVTTQARTDNIRLIRGDLSNPEVQIIDLSTIQGMQAASLRVQSGDIIYVQPVQRVVSEAIRDISPVLGLITSLITLIVLIDRLNP